MSSYWYASSPRGAINPRLYTGDKYGEYVWSRSYDDELWEFRSEDDRDRFVKDHEKYGAKSFAATGANLYAPTPCGSDGYQDYPLDPNCDFTTSSNGDGCKLTVAKIREAIAMLKRSAVEYELTQAEWDELALTTPLVEGYNPSFGVRIKIVD